jgi:2-phospho-L-lactate transferase
MREMSHQHSSPAESPDAARSLPPEIERALGKGREGLGLNREEALLLLQNAPTEVLLDAASTVRARFKGRVISFSKKVFIPLTTLCRDYCSYCTFRKDPGEPGAHFMTPDEVLTLAERARAAGCKEALFSLGDQPERVFSEAREFLRKQGFARTLDYLAAMCEMVLAKTGLLPHANPGVMDKQSLRRLQESNASVGLMLENVSPRLMRRGGPHENAPDKVPALRLRTIADAGELRIAFTTGILIGIGETLEDRVDSLAAIRELHEQYGHIQEVIVQNFRAKPDIPMTQWPEPTLDDMQRTLAVARLILPGQMNLQAPPNLSNDNFPGLLAAGINDWGGISPLTKDFINPEAAWPAIAHLREKTNAAGAELRERLAIYPEFARRPEFVSPAVRPRLEELADADGYARSGGLAQRQAMAGASHARRPRANKLEDVRITALAGGVGASKLLLGLAAVADPSRLTVIVNTGDDIVLHGLKISPDLDIVTYTLAGVVNPETGWGFRGESFRALERLGVLGRETWFNLGDRDLATHIHRSAMLTAGATLTDTADSIRRALGVKARILPMSNQPVPTFIETDEGVLNFQEYLVKRRAKPVVRTIRFANVEKAEPAPGVIEAIREAEMIVVCPSNPLISIGPILAVPGIREALREQKLNVLAVCPIVGGKSLKGPSDRMLAQLGYEVSACEVARLYADFAGMFVIDPTDRSQVTSIQSLGVRVVVLPTVMRTRTQKVRLARALLALRRMKTGSA